MTRARITLRLLPCILVALGAFLARGDDRDSTDRRIITWRFRSVFEDKGVVDARDLDVAKAGEQIGKLLSGGGDSSVAKTAAVFQALPFEEVEKVAKAGKIDGATSDALARDRRAMINVALGDALVAIDPEGRFTVGALDSGNKRSGIASDVDQTLFLMPIQRLKELGLNPSEMNNKLIAAFNEAFRKRYGYPPARLGIESMNGADFFPDWRQKHTAAELRAESDRVYLEKRPNLEAYRSEGQLKSQAEGRGFEALAAQTEKVQALEAARERIAEAGGARDAEAREVKALLEAGPLAEYKGKATSLEEVERLVAADSPWTEIHRDEAGRPVVKLLEAPGDKVLPNKPELARRFAFDGAWDNWLMWAHHAHNRPKYLLRSTAEGAGLLQRPDGKGYLTPYDYDSVFGRGDHRECARFVSETYAHLDDAARARMKAALDVAAKVRLKHKGHPAYKDLKPEQVYGEYVAEVKVRPEEAKLYAGAPKEVLDRIVLERATRAWEADAREVMIENLLLTADAPADILRGKIDEAELARLRKEGFEGATAEKLRLAAENELYHAFVDLLTPEHARALTTEDAAERSRLDAARPKDLVDRILARFASQGKGGDPVVQRVRELVVEAADLRVVLDAQGAHGGDPGGAEAAATSLKAIRARLEKRLRTAAAKVREAHARWKAGEAGYGSKELAGFVARETLGRSKDVGKLVLAEALERHQGRMAEFLHTLGFRVEVEEKPGARATEITVGEWKMDVALRNMVNAGNADAALTVWRAYLEGGGKAAAARAAIEQVVMSLPYVAEGAALIELVTKGDVKPAVMVGSAYFIPGTGQAYLIVSLATNVVAIGGYYVFEPLRSDTADAIYQGFLGKEEAGLITPGRKETEEARRPSVLVDVPIRVIPYTIVDEDGDPILDAEKKPQTAFAVAAYSFDEALAAGFLEPDDGGHQADFERLRAAGLLGGGQRWDELLARASREREDPVLHFEAKRASLFYHYEKRASAILDKLDIRLGDAKGAAPLLVQMFEKTIHDWLRGGGNFANRVDPEANLLIQDKVEAVKGRVAARMAGDFLRSYSLVRGGRLGSLEENMRAAIARARDERRRDEAARAAAALHAGRAGTDDEPLARALDRSAAARRLARGGDSARVWVRPRVVKAGLPGEPGAETVECLVSVIASPEVHPPGKDGLYRVEVEWSSVAGKAADEAILKARVTVRDGNGKGIGEPRALEIGVVAAATAQGPRDVECKQPAGPGVADVFLRSDALAKLDASNTPDVGLELRLYRAWDPGGPFTYVSESRVRVYPGGELRDAEDTRPGRVAKDRVRLNDQGGLEDERPWQRPFSWYKVGVLPLVGDAAREDKEVLSQVVGPEGARIDFSGIAPDATTADMPVLTPSLMLENQRVAIPGAHFTVTGNGGTSHYWSGRIVNGRRYFGEDIQVLSRTGATLSVRAEGQGFGATRSITVPPEPGAAESRASELARLREREQDRRRYDEEETARLAGEVKEKRREHDKAEADLAAARKREDPASELEHLENERKRAEHALETVVIRQQLFAAVERSAAEDALRAEMARASGDAAGALAVLQRAAPRAEQRYSLTLKEIAAFEKAYGASDETASRRKSAERRKSGDLRHAAGAIAGAAEEAGDFPAMEAAVREGIRLAAADGEPVEPGAAEGILANACARMTGDRGRAAALYRQGMAGSPEGRELLESGPLPAWWPE